MLAAAQNLKSHPPLITPWSRILSERLACPKLFKKFPALYETRKFIAAFTRTRQIFVSHQIVSVCPPIQPLKNPF
jgi:hypothetical protein